MKEICIEKVTYEDFGLLISTIYPTPVFPNDRTVMKLLELADRFLMPSVTHQVEHHLLHISRIRNEGLMWMADKFKMQRLLEKTIRKISSMEEAKNLEHSAGYSEMSNETKAKLFDRLMQFIKIDNSY